MCSESLDVQAKVVLWIRVCQAASFLHEIGNMLAMDGVPLSISAKEYPKRENSTAVDVAAPLDDR